MTLRRTPLPSRSAPLPRGTLRRTGWDATPSPPKRAGALERPRTSRKDTIPAAVRRQVRARDPWCIRCGEPYGLHCHHRRLKAIGGDPRPHTDCACNIIRLCSRCHDAVHTTDREQAGDDGYIISGEQAEPGMSEVLVKTADGGFTAWATCTGTWIFESPAEAS